MKCAPVLAGTGGATKSVAPDSPFGTIPPAGAMLVMPRVVVIDSKLPSGCGSTPNTSRPLKVSTIDCGPMRVATLPIALQRPPGSSWPRTMRTG